MPSKPQKDNGSFRDSSGFVFYSESIPYRAICFNYAQTFEFFISSGLYAALTDKQYLVSHRVVPETDQAFFAAAYPNTPIYKVIAPEVIPFISYPYEWCFSQLKAAALLTLQIQEEALKHGMTLKDASAYNIQFIGSRPVFIDTLSFDLLENDKPWPAYKQFCQHFLAPLVLTKYKSPELQRLSRLYMDGIPLHLASALLPYASYLNSLLAIHIHIHAKIEAKYGGRAMSQSKSKLKTTLKRQLGIVHHLKDGIQNIRMKSSKSIWSDYYQDHTYSDTALLEKQKLVKDWIAFEKPRITWDVGCNTGLFSEIAAMTSVQTIAFDSDFMSVENFYNRIHKGNIEKILPLIIDIAHPTPSLGWAGEERKSLSQRGPADLILALALLHHLAIGQNIPFTEIASYFNKCTKSLIIEFVPKEDKQTQKLLVTKKDVFDQYHVEAFLEAFSEYFTIFKRAPIADSGRELFWMKKMSVRK